MKKGQISLTAIISIGLSILVPAIGGYFMQSRRIDDKVSVVEEKLGGIKERTAKLEEAVQTIKEDNRITREQSREDLKNFLKELKR